MNHDIEAIPPGFKILSERPELKIKYRSQPNGCLTIFIMLFIIVMGSVFGLIMSTVNWEQNWSAISFIMIFLFLFFGLLIYAVLGNTFGITTFVISPDQLTIDKELFGMHSTKNISSANIHYFRQVKDGGEGEDSFPTWGLKLITNQMKIKNSNLQKKAVMFVRKFANILNISFDDMSKEMSKEMLEEMLEDLSRENYVLIDRQAGTKSSDWLGMVLADFYQVEFRPTRNRE